MKDLYDVGQAPPLGEVPPNMHAWLIRQDRFGEPRTAFRREVVPVPAIADDEVLVYVMAAGINYNNVWAALGAPVDVIAARQKAGEPEPFHIGGSDASGIVHKVGARVKRLRPGDEVVVHCGTWSQDDPVVRSGRDPMYAPSFRIWGYETNYGSFAQFTRVQEHQCLPKPRHLTWEAAAAYMLVGATAYRMLLGWGEHALRRGDAVLIWGGAGGLGSLAIQIARAHGAVPVAVVSHDDKVEYTKRLGAKGAINRKSFKHWGMLPHWRDQVGYAAWLKGVREFGKAFWEALGEKRNPRIVFEHPGEETIPTSIFVCDTGGMVAICAGTTGYNATVDLRYLWMRQKRLQGSHFANDEQARALNDMVVRKDVDPCLSRVFPFDELAEAHQLMHENKHPHGNMAVLVGAPDVGAKTLAPLAAEPEVVYSRPRPPIDAARLAPDTGVTVRFLAREGVIACAPGTPVLDVARLMLEKRSHTVLVVDERGDAAGVVSQTNVALARQGRTRADLQAMTAASIMTPDVITCDLDTPVSEAVTTMTRHRIHGLVVIDRSGGRRRPVGVLTMSDIVRKTLEATV